MTVRVKPHTCLRCGKTMDAAHLATDVDGIVAPDEGAVSLCAYCGNTAFWTEDGWLREPTEAEWVSLWHDPGYMAAFDAVHLLIAHRKHTL